MTVADNSYTMEKVAQIWDSVPQYGQWALAGVGALYVATRVGAFLQLLLNAFILSGTNVRLFAKSRLRMETFLETLANTPVTAPQVWQEGHLGRRYRRL